MAKNNSNWIVLATFQNGKPEPHEILANTTNLSTQGTRLGTMKDTLLLVQEKNVKITVFDKPLFKKICTNEGVNYQKFKSVINFK